MGAVILRLEEVKKRTGKSRSTIYSDMSKGTFPKNIKLGKNSASSGWIESEISQYLDDLIAVRDSEVA